MIYRQIVNVILFIIILLSISCSDDKKQALYDKYYKNAERTYQDERYFKRVDQKDEMSRTECYQSVECYKVYFNHKTKLPIEETYIKNQIPLWTKEYHFVELSSGKYNLKNVTMYSNKKLKLSETIYNEKNVILMKYIYYLNSGVQNRIERYVNGKKREWWTYYNKKNQLIKKEYYGKDGIEGTWLFFYNTNGTFEREESYDANMKLLYKHNVLTPTQ